MNGVQNIEFLSGIVADHKRDILDGKEYEKYFPAANLKNGTLKRNGSVSDTVQLMGDIVYQTLSDTKKIAKVLYDTQISGGKPVMDLNQTCSNIWHFCYKNIQYKLDDPGKEQLRRPARAFADRFTGIDCDCFSIFISSILTNLRIPHKFRITKYDGGWQHVYVVVPTSKDGKDYITIDPVLDRYNYEKPFTANKDYNMSTHTTLGIPIEYLSGLGIDDADTQDIITGADFESILSGADEDTITPQQALDNMYNHLVKTRDSIMRNPSSVIAQGGSENWLKMLNYAISNWNTSNRDAALDALEKEEERWAKKLEGINGLGEAGDEEGDYVLGKTKVGKFFSNIKAGVKKVGQAVATGAKTVANKVLKPIAKGVMKFNPVSIAVRNAYLLMLKLNVFNISSRLQKNPAAYAKVKKMFVDTLQGKEANLKKQIDIGTKKGLRGLGDLTVTGLGVEPVTTTAVVTAASVPVIETLKALDDKDKSEGKEGIVKKILAWFKSKLSKKEQSEVEKTSLSPSAEDSTPSPGKEGGEEEEEKPEQDKGDGFFKKVGKFYTKQPVLAWGLTAVGAFGVSLLFPPVRRAVGLGGVKQYRSKKRLYTKFLPAGRKVKSITYAGA